MSFDPTRLPGPRPFFEGEGLTLKGIGAWCTTHCDFHGGSDSMRVNTAIGNWRCMNCETKGGDVLSYYMQRHGVGFIEGAKALGAWVDDDDDTVRRDSAPKPRPLPPQGAVPEVRTTLSPHWRAFWRDECLTPFAGVARAYAEARNLVLPPADGHLRWHPNVKHWQSDYEGPALVSLITDAVTGEWMSMQFAWIKANGTKSNVKPARLLLPGHRKTGGVVRLWPDECVTQGLGVCEGIETALSLAHGYKPAWACLDASNLAQFPVLDGIDFLIIGADHDDPGIDAAQRCMARWKAAGREAAVVMPREPKFDLNDLVRAAA